MFSPIATLHTLDPDILPGGVLIFGSLVPVLVYLVWKFALSSKHRAVVPPGPPGKPFIGNALQFPKVEPWLKLRELGRKYGDVSQMKLFNKKLIMLNSYDAVVDLFDKRSALYCHRPPRTMALLCGFTDAIVFQNYGEKFRGARKMLSAEIGPRGVTGHYSLLLEEARLMARRLLDAQGAASRQQEVKLTSSRVLLMVGFGHQVQTLSIEDPLVRHAEIVGEFLSDCTRSGKYLVDSFPILKYLPAWVPGCGFQKDAKKSREVLDWFLNVPFYDVKKKMANGNALPCFVSKSLEKFATTKQDEELVKWTAGGIYGAGLDTTRSALDSFFLAMTMFPEAQAKAQEELDRVLGPGILPTFADRKRLPYIEGVLKETLRWNPSAPLVTHSTVVDDEYKGFKIPACSMVVANTWAYTHDPETYADPLIFNPGRYTPSQEPGSEKSPQTDPRQYAFGYGRRTCPGMHLADAFLFITISTILTLFNISPELDKQGQPILPKIVYSTGAVSHPPDFSCIVQKRSDAAEKLIRDATD
ncbi:hypothetical protein M0805_006559 [Coniferiporia weirii]|nr:hypothetical protein M0805_006559 [Coniferiporia weirii]